VKLNTNKQTSKSQIVVEISIVGLLLFRFGIRRDRKKRCLIFLCESQVMKVTCSSHDSMVIRLILDQRHHEIRSLCLRFSKIVTVSTEQRYVSE